MSKVPNDTGMRSAPLGAFNGAAGTAATQAATDRPAPFSLRLTFEERAVLEAQAGHMPLGAYIRARLLGGAAMPRKVHRRPVKDDEALARVLGALGNARLSNNLNQLARAANAGALPVTPETMQALIAACRDVRDMRAGLMAALGLDPGGP
ncbi:MAG TPA: plasmid mobilization relaxosome protein MobC [Methylibium sp.]|nr:plasmid mobilization relaxosome protein MobC [Methylibium sp.]